MHKFIWKNLNYKKKTKMSKFINTELKLESESELESDTELESQSELESDTDNFSLMVIKSCFKQCIDGCFLDRYFFYGCFLITAY